MVLQWPTLGALEAPSRQLFQVDAAAANSCAHTRRWCPIPRAPAKCPSSIARRQTIADIDRRRAIIAGVVLSQPVVSTTPSKKYRTGIDQAE